MRYVHSMLRISNIETSLDFYCNKLGLVEVRRVENEQARFTLIFLAADEDQKSVTERRAPELELTYNWDAEHYDNARNFGHLAYRVADINSYCQDLLDKGVTINRPPRDGHMAFIKSPDGISIELLQENGPIAAIEPWISMPNNGTW